MPPCLDWHPACHRRLVEAVVELLGVVRAYVLLSVYTTSLASKMRGVLLTLEVVLCHPDALETDAAGAGGDAETEHSREARS